MVRVTEGFLVLDITEAEEALDALLATWNPPTNYELTSNDVNLVATCFDWVCMVNESNWSRNTNYRSVADMIRSEPAAFLTDLSRYYGDDYYL